ncbi:MAG: glycosyltransferase family 39 protein [Chloroflexota bacterium]|nr:glycosyltransferase family 39 protein [Chloroflexota bacterium]
MNASHNPKQQNQQPQNQYGGQPPLPSGPPQQPPRQPEAKDPGSVTLFRTGNFFVHAFTPIQKTGRLQNASGNATILERIRWTSAEKQRLLAAQTRLLPQIDTFDNAQWQEIPIPAWLEAIAVAFVIGLTMLLQALNIFNYPAYSVDEGNVMSNAWAILHGMITPYAYTYDHPPLGWIQIAAWIKLTGGLSSFGNAINSGRILMLLLAGASSLLLYLIASRLSGSRSAALLAVIIYTLSPLCLLYRREVLLDNIGIFWLLLSLSLITAGKSRLMTFVMAAVALGIAILSKGMLILFVPAMLYAVWLYATPFQRKFSLLVFLYVTFAVTSAFVLLALLKGELLPPGLFPWDKGAHLSLIGTLVQAWQTSVQGGQFRATWNSWLSTDLLLLAAGTVAMFVNILGGTVNRFQLLTAFFSATYTLYLLLSNASEPAFIVPLLPFLALNIAMALNIPLRWVTRKTGFDLGRAMLIFIVIGVLLTAGLQQATLQQTKNAAEPQRQALIWVRNNVSRNATIVTNSELFTDLREPGGMGVGDTKPFSHAQIYSSASMDPTVYASQWKGNWQNINYIVVDPTMQQDIQSNPNYALLNEALHHGILQAQFGSSQDGTLIQIYQVIK